jgi:signal transduction histidine kinase
MRSTNYSSQRSEGRVFFIGTLVFCLFAVVVVLTHLSRLREARAVLIESELPRVAKSAEDQLLSYFDLNVRTLRLLADVYDWQEMFDRFAADPAEARLLANSYATALGVRSVDFVDLPRRLVHAYWSPEPIILDPTQERDAWFFETWDIPDPPETKVTLYYDEDMGGNAVYTDQLLRGADQEPIGLVGILTDLSTLARHIQRTLIGDEHFFLFGAGGAVMLHVSYDSFREFGPVYSIEGRSLNPGEDIPEELIGLLTSRRDRDDIYISQRISIPGLDVEGVVYLNARSRLGQIRLSVLGRMAILLLSYVVLVGSYSALMVLHARRLRANAAVIEEHRERLDDIVSVLTHNLSNDVHALRQRFVGRFCDLLPARVGETQPYRSTVTVPDRSIDAILLDMEQVLQNAIYSAQLGSTAVRQTVGEAAADDMLHRLYDACHAAASAKRQRIELINSGDTLVETDQDLLFHVLFNLAGNAIKYSPPGTTVVYVAGAAGLAVDFYVIDQGPGFSADDRQGLFRKSRRLSARPTSGERSTGMGLYVAARLADIIGVTITLLDELPDHLRGSAADLSPLGAVWRVRVSELPGAVT